MLVGVMPNVVMQDVTEIDGDMTFGYCYRGKPDLSSSLTRVVTSSPENALNLSAFGTSLNSLWVDGEFLQ